ncbi:MAG: MBL fold metallo-hydrolase [Myxococcota bacterium]
MDITFCGGAGTVTGSRYLVRTSGPTLLVDCGLFQGLKELRLRNWDAPPFNPAEVDAVLLTHAHIDHSGYLPVLGKRGFTGRVYCTRPTRDLCQILLSDSARLQEEEAGYARRHGYSKHTPPLPLYTEEDAARIREHFRAVDVDTPVELGGGVRARFLLAGHILGAAMILLEDGAQRVLFSGDLGRPKDPMMPAPTTGLKTDWLLVESTYGNRRHVDDDPEAELAQVITRTVARGGTVVVPAFCVGRAQLLLYHLARLKRAHAIPDVPVFLNSPMAQETGALYPRHRGYHRLNDEECWDVCNVARHAVTVQESKDLHRVAGPKVLIAGSGMATGGRVLHHLKAYAPDEKNTVLFVGHQAVGTRGAAMVAGAESVKIHGEQVPIRAEVVKLDLFSAHADGDEILAWLRTFRAPPEETFVTHGEPEAAEALRARVAEELGWRVRVARHLETVTWSSST